MEDAISILRGLRERFEVFHGVKIQDSALVAAVVLSHRYITDRFLPDKAIDLVDESCAMLRTEIDSLPAELDELTRRVTRLEIEEAALAKEKDKASKQRLEELRKELADLRVEADAMRAQWEAERQALKKVQALREEIERVRLEADQAERAYDLERAAELRFGRLAELERRLAAEEQQLAAKQGGTRLLREVVTEEEIPDTLQGIILARVDRLAHRERNTIQHAAVIGRTFSADLLGAVLGDDPESSLIELARSQLVETEGDGQWTFLHALIQEVTYDMLLVDQRRDLHCRIAEVMEGNLNQGDVSLELLAYHYAEAEAREKARQIGRAHV